MSIRTYLNPPLSPEKESFAFFTTFHMQARERAGRKEGGREGDSLWRHRRRQTHRKRKERRKSPKSERARKRVEGREGISLPSHSHPSLPTELERHTVPPTNAKGVGGERAASHRYQEPPPTSLPTLWHPPPKGTPPPRTHCLFFFFFHRHPFPSSPSRAMPGASFSHFCRLLEEEENPRGESVVEREEEKRERKRGERRKK